MFTSTPECLKINLRKLFATIYYRPFEPFSQDLGSVCLLIYDGAGRFHS